jgi:hypothetical protein
MIAEAARRGASGPNKRAILKTCLLKKMRAEKQLFTEAQKGKRQPAKESTMDKERRLL